MLLIGIDDTDSPQGGCTTAIAALVAARFARFEPDGPPRLVRLNPNVPWKTRGNAAIALRFRQDADLDAALSSVLAIVDREAQRAEGTEPGVVVAREPPAEAIYTAAVTRVVERAEVDDALAKVGARAWGGRGVIGAAAAIAWDPFREPPRASSARFSYERIAYRAPERVGSARDVDASWAREVEWTYTTTFDSYDLANREVVCVPSGPDPVLWGIRGDDPRELALASGVMGPERPARETLFLTNQGSDDHLVDRRVAECAEYLSARVRARVAGRPTETGGCVFLDVADDTGALRVAAYPPARQLRHVVRALAPGDDITACGGLHMGPDGRLTLGIEKLHVHQTAPRVAGPPVCPACSRSMDSAGKNAGYRCRHCGTKAPGPRRAESIVRQGWHEVPASARRHLAAPLKRIRS